MRSFEFDILNVNSVSFELAQFVSKNDRTYGRFGKRKEKTNKVTGKRCLGRKVQWKTKQERNGTGPKKDKDKNKERGKNKKRTKQEENNGAFWMEKRSKSNRKTSN